MKNPHDIILRPVLTEKGYDGIADKQYVFEVDIHANKVEIKRALEAVFKDIKVEKVNTLRTIGKIKRQGRMIPADSCRLASAVRRGSVR